MKAEVDKRQQALARMAAICSRREYCTADIRGKLKKYELSEEVVDGIIGELQREKYLSDQRYAAAYARDKGSLAGWGPKKIAFHLRAKEIAPEVIKEAMREIDVQRAEQKMEEVLLRKWKSLSREEDLGKRRMKTVKFALGRGYSYEEVWDFVKGLEQ